MKLQDLVISITPDVNIGPIKAIEDHLSNISKHISEIGDQFISLPSKMKIIEGGISAAFAVDEKRMAETAALMGKHINFVKDTYMAAVGEISSTTGVDRMTAWEGIRQAHRGGISDPKKQTPMVRKASMLSASGFGSQTDIVSAATTGAVAAGLDPIDAVDLLAKGVQAGEGVSAGQFSPGFKSLAGLSGTSGIPFEDLWASLVGMSTTDKNIRRATTKIGSFFRDIFSIGKTPAKAEALMELSEEAFGDPNAVTPRKLISMVKEPGGIGKLLDTINVLTDGGRLENLLRLLTSEGAQLPGLLDRGLFEQKRDAIRDYRGTSEKVYEDTAGETVVNQLKRIGQQINELSTVIGEKLMPLTKALLAPVEGALGLFKKLGGETLGAFATAVSTATAGLLAIGFALKGVAFILQNWGIAVAGGALGMMKGKGSGLAGDLWEKADKHTKENKKGRGIFLGLTAFGEHIKIDTEKAKSAAGFVAKAGVGAIGILLAGISGFVLSIIKGITELMKSGGAGAITAIFTGKNGIFTVIKNFLKAFSEGGIAGLLKTLSSSALGEGIKNFTKGIGGLAKALVTTKAGMLVLGAMVGASVYSRLNDSWEKRKEERERNAERRRSLQGVEIGSSVWFKRGGDKLEPGLTRRHAPTYQITAEGIDAGIYKWGHRLGVSPDDFFRFDEMTGERVELTEKERLFGLVKPIRRSGLIYRHKAVQRADHVDNIIKEKKRAIDSAIASGANPAVAKMGVELGLKWSEKDNAWLGLLSKREEWMDEFGEIHLGARHLLLGTKRFTEEQVEDKWHRERGFGERPKFLQFFDDIRAGSEWAQKEKKRKDDMDIDNLRKMLVSEGFREEPTSLLDSIMQHVGMILLNPFDALMQDQVNLSKYPRMANLDHLMRMQMQQAREGGYDFMGPWNRSGRRFAVNKDANDFATEIPIFNQVLSQIGATAGWGVDLAIESLVPGVPMDGKNQTESLLDSLGPGVLGASLGWVAAGKARKARKLLYGGLGAHLGVGLTQWAGADEEEEDLLIDSAWGAAGLLAGGYVGSKLMGMRAVKWLDEKGKWAEGRAKFRAFEKPPVVGRDKDGNFIYGSRLGDPTKKRTGFSRLGGALTWGTLGTIARLIPGPIGMLASTAGMIAAPAIVNLLQELTLLKPILKGIEDIAKKILDWIMRKFGLKPEKPESGESPLTGMSLGDNVLERAAKKRADKDRDARESYEKALRDTIHLHGPTRELLEKSEKAKLDKALEKNLKEYEDSIIEIAGDSELTERWLKANAILKRPLHGRGGHVVTKNQKEKAQETIDQIRAGENILGWMHQRDAWLDSGAPTNHPIYRNLQSKIRRHQMSIQSEKQAENKRNYLRGTDFYGIDGMGYDVPGAQPERRVDTLTKMVDSFLNGKLSGITGPVKQLNDAAMRAAIIATETKATPEQAILYLSRGSTGSDDLDRRITEKMASHAGGAMKNFTFGNVSISLVIDRDFDHNMVLDVLQEKLEEAAEQQIEKGS